jgi:hypothetical protein
MRATGTAPIQLPAGTPGGDSLDAALERGSALVARLVQAGDSAAPRGPADVVGGDWSPWVLGVLALALVLALGWSAVRLRAWAGRRNWRGWIHRLTSPSPRQTALRELDEIRGMGLHTNGRIDEFYARTTDVARRFTRSVDPSLGPSLTSSEFIARLSELRGAGSVDRLARVIEVAELTKFGRHHPDPGAAESDWAAVRDWIRSPR